MMLRPLRGIYSDESGIAMALAVMVLVIVGVMGAGLLVFVRNDLESVVQVNQGQSAFDIADAGTQAAKQQILSDKTPGHYDVEGGAPTCDSSQESPALIGEDWSLGAGGVSKTFAGGKFDVTIQWLNQNPSADPSCIAPETTSSPADGVDYFRVISTGTYGGATRKVETIYNTYDLGVPKAYYSPSNIKIAGSANVNDVSVFSGGDVSVKGGAAITGEDKAYGNWKNEYNNEPRPTSAAGVGALGSITGSGAKDTRDFDQGTTPPFVSDPSSGEMTFPFNAESQSSQANKDRIDFLRDEAKRQGNYELRSGGGNDNLDTWPTNDNNNTVVFVEFKDPATLKWNVPGDCNNNPDNPDGTAKGTLIVKNGSFTTSQHQALLQGVVIVRGGAAEGDSTDTGGNTCIDGFVNASGEIKLAGNVEPYASQQVVDRPGFHGVKRWSWRELYQ